MLSRILVIFTLFSFAAQADDLSSLRKQLNAIDTFSASFEQVVKDEQGEILQQGSGELVLSQPAKMRWQQAIPDETLLVSNDDKTYYYDSFAEQVTIFNSQNLIKSTPFILLTSKDETTWQQYQVNKVSNGFKISPKSLDNAQVVSLSIYFSPLDGLNALERLEIEDISGQISFITFSDRKVNQTIAATKFEFVIPDDVEVDDQSTQIQ